MLNKKKRDLRTTKWIKKKKKKTLSEQYQNPTEIVDRGKMDTPNP